jgi:hypothetical protein
MLTLSITGVMLTFFQLVTGDVGFLESFCLIGYVVWRLLCMSTSTYSSLKWYSCHHGLHLKEVRVGVPSRGISLHSTALSHVGLDTADVHCVRGHPAEEDSLLNTEFYPLDAVA